MREKFLIGLFIVLAIVLVLALLIVTNLQGYYHTMGELHDTIGEIGRAIGAGIQMVFWVGLVLAVLSIGVWWYREHNVIRPTKHGPAQAVKYGRELIAVPIYQSLTTPVQAGDEIERALKMLAQMQKVAKQMGMRIDEEKTVESDPSRLLGAGSPMIRPTLPEMVQNIARNSLEIIMGRSRETLEWLRVELLDAHIKLIGGSRMGKSCEAAAIIDQVRQTHDPDVLVLALLDLENKTSRLFEGDPHILRINTGYKQVTMHARDVAQVADCLIHLHDLMVQRSDLTDAELLTQPHVLIYLEEFLYWKKLLGQFVSSDIREKALASFAGIATRGIKYGLHLMACAQVDYADDELKDAMAQFLAVNVAFSVKPSAAQAAGFVNYELLKKNYIAREQGQFVIEAIGFSDIGVAPEYDVRAKLKSMTSVSANRIGDIVSEVGSSGNTLETLRETASEDQSCRIIDDVFPASLDTPPVSIKQENSEAETWIRETIRRMKKRNMSDREIAPLVGLAGRKYSAYQQICRELGFPSEQRESEA